MSRDFGLTASAKLAVIFVPGQVAVSYGCWYSYGPAALLRYLPSCAISRHGIEPISLWYRLVYQTIRSTFNPALTSTGQTRDSSRSL